MRKSESSSRSEQFNPPLLIVGLVLLLLPIVGGVFFFCSGKTAVSNVPIPAGHVEIRVEFKGLSTKNYNDLTSFV